MLPCTPLLCPTSVADGGLAAHTAIIALLTPAMLLRAQGICCILTGLWGSGNGTTAYNENIGAMQVLGARPRRRARVSALNLLSWPCVLASNAHAQVTVTLEVCHKLSCRQMQGSCQGSAPVTERALMSVERQPQTTGPFVRADNARGVAAGGPDRGGDHHDLCSHRCGRRRTGSCACAAWPLLHQGMCMHDDKQQTICALPRSHEVSALFEVIVRPRSHACGPVVTFCPTPGIACNLVLCASAYDLPLLLTSILTASSAQASLAACSRPCRRPWSPASSASCSGSSRPWASRSCSSPTPTARATSSSSASASTWCASARGLPPAGMPACARCGA